MSMRGLQPNTLHPFEFSDAALGVFGLPSCGLGLLPQLGVAAKQVVE